MQLNRASEVLAHRLRLRCAPFRAANWDCGPPKVQPSRDRQGAVAPIIQQGSGRTAPRQAPDAIGKLDRGRAASPVLSRVLPIDEAVAQRWGAIAAHAQRKGRPLAVIDGLLAATALQHTLTTIVSRNVRSFANVQVSILNPWMR